MSQKLTFEKMTDSSRSSKYGKFRKRKKSRGAMDVEPDVIEQLPSPNILVHHKQQLLSSKSSIVRFWDKMRLEPVSGPKVIRYAVLTPSNEGILLDVQEFFRELSTVYGMCRLGSHETIALPGSNEGIVPIAMGRLKVLILFTFFRRLTLLFIKCGTETRSDADKSLHMKSFLGSVYSLSRFRSLFF